MSSRVRQLMLTVLLEKFQLFMEKVMKRSGLVWGSNNLLGARQNQNEEKNNKYGSMLKDKATELLVQDSRRLVEVQNY